MIDREMNNEEWCKKNCPYYPDCSGGGVCNTVLSLLKEQEAEISKISNAYLDLVGKASKQPDYMPKKGSWIRHGEPPEYVIECSRCGQKYFCHAMQTLANYCSMCGARMESWIVENQAEMT